MKSQIQSLKKLVQSLKELEAQIEKLNEQREKLRQELIAQLPPDGSPVYAGPWKVFLKWIQPTVVREHVRPGHFRLMITPAQPVSQTSQTETEFKVSKP